MEIEKYSCTYRFCLHAAAKVNMLFMQKLEIFVMCKKKKEKKRTLR